MDTDAKQNYKLLLMQQRYRNRPNPNMKGMSWLPQEGDEGIGFRHTKPKPGHKYWKPNNG